MGSVPSSAAIVVLLIGRVLGLLSVVSKQLGSEVDVASLLMPYVGRLMTEGGPDTSR